MDIAGWIVAGILALALAGAIWLLVIFATARVNDGIVGLSPELELSEGFDGRMNWPEIPGDRDDPDFAPTTLRSEDVIELADHMIERWQKFKASVVGAKER